MKSKKIGLLLLSLILFTGCSKSSDFDKSKEISVISREDGSGTRGAFVELLKIEQKNSDGTKKDLTTKEAIIAKQTDIMLTSVSNDSNAIGYVSLGSLNETVKAVKINGVDASAETIKDHSYPVARPFNIATKGEASGNVKDFIEFIFSTEGQKIVSEKYIAVKEKTHAYSGKPTEGKITISGSSSVSPLMEKLIEAYKKINPQVEIELQTNDSSSGMKSTIEQTSDIGMASRSLKDSEKEQLTSVEIALDGVVVIVNKKNPITELTSDQIKDIFMGKVTTWSDVTQ